MFRFKVLVLIPFLATLIQPLATHASSASLVFSEIQTGSATNTGQEFVELYNPTAVDVSIDGWLLQYKSATSAVAESSWAKRTVATTLSGTVKSHGFYLISQKAYLPAADADLSTAGLSGIGGHLRLKDKSGAVVDLVGWGATANAAETSPALAPAAGQSIERLPGRLQENGGDGTDTDNNSKDFILRTIPQPQSGTSAVEIPAVAGPIIVDDPPADDQPAPAPLTYSTIMITELMPDPAAPLTDAHDEFVELYNPNATEVNLKGYVIKAGTNFNAFYNLPDQVIAAGAYLSVYAKDSHISLTNTGGAAQILDPTGLVVGTADNYGKAVTGQSWSLIDGVWKWSVQSTPGAENIYEAPPVPEPKVTVTAPKAKTVTPPAAKLKATAAFHSTGQASTPKATKTTAPKATKVKKSTKTPQTALVAASTNHSGSWLIIVLAALSIGYAIYEFRYDVRNYYHITRRYLKTRGGAGPSA